jgi:hypothetical protein
MTHVARTVEAAGVAEIARAIPATPWKTLRVSHSSHRPGDERVRLFQLSTKPGQSHSFGVGLSAAGSLPLAAGSGYELGEQFLAGR